MSVEIDDVPRPNGNNLSSRVHFAALVSSNNTTIEDVTVNSVLDLSGTTITLNDTNINFSDSVVDLTDAVFNFDPTSSVSGLSGGATYADITFVGPSTTSSITTSGFRPTFNFSAGSTLAMTNTNINWAGSFIDTNALTSIGNATLTNSTLFPGEDIIFNTAGPIFGGGGNVDFTGSTFSPTIFGSTPALLTYERNAYTWRHSFTAFYTVRGVFSWETWKDSVNLPARTVSTVFKWSKVGRTVFLTSDTFVRAVWRETVNYVLSNGAGNWIGGPATAANPGGTTGITATVVFNDFDTFPTTTTVMNPGPFWPPAYDPLILSATTFGTNELSLPLVIARGGNYNRGNLMVKNDPNYREIAWRQNNNLNPLNVGILNPGPMVGPYLPSSNEQVGQGQPANEFGDAGGMPSMAGWYGASFTYVSAS